MKYENDSDLKLIFFPVIFCEFVVGVHQTFCFLVVCGELQSKHENVRDAKIVENLDIRGIYSKRDKMFFAINYVFTIVLFLI